MIHDKRNFVFSKSNKECNVLQRQISPTPPGQPFSCGLYEVCCNLETFPGSQSINDQEQCGRPNNNILKGRVSIDLPAEGDADFGNICSRILS